MGRGRRRAGQPPSLLLHKSSGQAYATVAGKRYYFGQHGSPEAIDNYTRFLARWQAEHGRQIVAEADDARSIAAVVREYLADIKGGLSAGEWKNIERDLARLTDRFGQLRPDDLRPLHIKAIRKTCLDDGLCRSTINQCHGRLLRFVRWCVAHDDEICSPETRAVLEAIPPLPVGKGKESVPVQPVPRADLVKTLRHLPSRIRAMVIVQLYAGPRPGEVCRMRGREIFRSGAVVIEGRAILVPAGVWLFRPGRHKTKSKGKEVVYVLGPKCQAALKPFLRDNPDEPIFSPADVDRDRKAAMRAARKSPVQPSQVDRSKKWARRKPGAMYTPNTYRQVVVRTCQEHDIEAWHPNQLRHGFVTRMDSIAGLVLSSAAVGHSQLATTLIYLENQIAKVAPIMARVG